MKNKKISKIGILVFCVALCAIVGTAAIIEHFGSVTIFIDNKISFNWNILWFMLAQFILLAGLIVILMINYSSGKS